MTEKALAEIVDEARNRWPLGRVTVIHRIGELWPGDEIVFVGVTSAHRSSAFEAGQFIMDYLKTRAPFWKREPRRKATAGLKLGRAISRRQNAGSFLLAG